MGGDDKTKWIFDDSETGPSGFEEERTATDAFTETLDDPAEDTTRFVDPPAEKTQIYYPGMEADLGDAAKFTGETDPVVGWLVVVKGPGIGRSVSIGTGMNMLGRAADERIALPFGDTLMSANDHVRIIYDDETRAFFISHGSGKSLTKVDGKMVANTLPLQSHALIELTKTTHVRFVAFCNETFDWSDVDIDGTA